MDSREISRIVYCGKEITKILYKDKVIYPYYKYRWRKHNIAYEGRQRHIVTKTPKTKQLSYDSDISDDFYTDYKLENGKIIFINKKQKYDLPGEFTYYTTGGKTYEKKYHYEGTYYEEPRDEIEEVYLPPGFYQCEMKKKPKEVRDYKHGGTKTVYVDAVYLIAELKVEKETYKVEVKGDYIATVGSNEENEYPENGIKDGYWYEFVEWNI